MSRKTPKRKRMSGRTQKQKKPASNHNLLSSEKIALVKKILRNCYTFDALFKGNFVPKNLLKKLTKALIKIKGKNKSKVLKSLERINELFQDVFFEKFKGLFRFEIVEDGDGYLVFASKKPQKFLECMLAKQPLKDVKFSPDTALVLGSTVENFCKRLAYLLAELAKRILP